MRFAALTAVAALCVALAGSAAPAAGPENVEITNIGTDYWAGPLYVAQRNHLFEKHGLKASVTNVKGGSLALQTVLTKQADVALLSYEHILKAAVQGQRIVAVFRIVSRPVNNLVMKNAVAQGTEHMSLADKVRKLKGLRIGLPSAGGSGETILHVLGAKYGLRANADYTTVYLGSDPASYVTAFEHDQIDAALPTEPAGVLVQSAGYGKTVINLMRGEVPELNDLLYMCLAVNPETLKNRPDVVKAVTATFQEALATLGHEPRAGADLMGQTFPALPGPANQAAYAVSRSAWPGNGRMTADQARRVLTYMTAQGGLNAPANFDLAATFTNDFAP
jgi:NitT/TauT family transport system substrate-binding protein